MTVTLNLNPEVEKGLMARARARGYLAGRLHPGNRRQGSGFARRSRAVPNSEAVR